MEQEYSVNIRQDEAEAEETLSAMKLFEIQAEKSYDPENRQYSVYLRDDGNVGRGLSYDRLELLSNSPQSDLRKTLNIINICRQYVNYDDIIGLTNESIENNINTKVRLSYKRVRGEEPKKTQLDEVKHLINDFNEKINLSALIVKSVTTTWRDGTYIMCLRQQIMGNGEIDYVVDYYPLGVAVISPYEVGGNPYILIDIQELRNRLQKNYPKNKKRKGIFFDNMEQEVKATYPEEVYKAFMVKEKFAKIPIECSGVLRINNQNKEYGLSSIFRALYPTLMLEAFGRADRATAAARSKKIVAQFLHKEILGENYTRDGYTQQSYAHKNFLDAWKQKTVVVTPPATVADIKYIEPTAETTNINLVNYYRQKAMNTLGISFLANGSSSSLSVANISLTQLMKTINKISRQLEGVLEKWYAMVLRDNGYDVEFAPTIHIIDAEMMEMDMKNDLVDTLFTKLNCSYETAYELLGVDIDDEKLRRKAENEEGVEDVFMPRLTAYTASGNNSGSNDGGDGRPATNIDTNKQGYDRERNKAT